MNFRSELEQRKQIEIHLHRCFSGDCGLNSIHEQTKLAADLAAYNGHEIGGEGV